jgi:hypothetical protein
MAATRDVGREVLGSFEGFRTRSGTLGALVPTPKCLLLSAESLNLCLQFLQPSSELCAAQLLDVPFQLLQPSSELCAAPSMDQLHLSLTVRGRSVDGASAPEGKNA